MENSANKPKPEQGEGSLKSFNDYGVETICGTSENCSDDEIVQTTTF